MNNNVPQDDGIRERDRLFTMIIGGTVGAIHYFTTRSNDKDMIRFFEKTEHITLSKKVVSPIDIGNIYLKVMNDCLRDNPQLIVRRAELIWKVLGALDDDALVHNCHYFIEFIHHVTVCILHVTAMMKTKQE